MARLRKYKGKPVDKEMDDWLKKVKFFVEADSFAQSTLWKEFSVQGRQFIQRTRGEDEIRVSWDQETRGFNLTIGEIKVGRDRLPINISFSFATINGIYICFYEGISQLVHHAMIEDFLHTLYPVKYDKGTRLAYTNASNFHHCLHFCKEEKNKRYKLTTQNV